MIDLHAHTTVSDGSLSPTELVKLAKEQGLKAIAITDHDNISGIKEAKVAAKALDITLIEGIEFDVVYEKGRRMHILGLGIDSENPKFLSIYNEYRKGREERLDYVLDLLRPMGVTVDRDRLMPHKVGQYFDRQAIAKYLVVEGYAPMMKNAWVDYLDKIPFISGELIGAKEAFEAIHAAGGKAFLAHYHYNLGLNGYNEEERLTVLEDLKGMGLDGLEAYYPSFSEEDQRRCDAYVKRFDFLKSGGSDFHGANRPHIQLGVGEGDFRVPDTLLEAIMPNEPLVI